MEKRLFVSPQQMGDEFGRDRSRSLESSDSWMERGPVSLDYVLINNYIILAP